MRKHWSVARRALMVLAAVAVAGAWSVGRPAADPVAVVVQVTGTVQVQRAGQNSAAAATIGTNLNAGDKVIVGTGAKAVLMYKSGKMEPATQTLTITEPSTPQSGGRFDQTVKTLAQVATTNARAQPNRQGMIRPVQGEPVQVAPRNGVKVIDLRPTFTWLSIPGVSGYTVQLRRLQPAASRPERFDVGKDTTWTLPPTMAPLIPGGEYEWTVGVQSGRIAPTQRFRVVTADDFAQIALTMRELTTAGIDPLTDGLFVTALAYRDAGLFYEADRALEKLASGGAGNGRAFHMLHGEVLDAIGRVDAAAKHFAKADTEPGS